MDTGIAEIYGNKVRMRACGICWQTGRLLLVNHKGITDGDFWAPPGGGVDFGASLTETLTREFREETGLEVTPGSFLFGCEFVHPPLHAVELFFEVSIAGGTLAAGYDPELQIIEDARFFSPGEIQNIPPQYRHGIFNRVESMDAFGTLCGFYTI